MAASWEHMPSEFLEATSTRLEPSSRTTDIAEGIQARTADPLWMLARQWQCGEFAAENAGSPIFAEVEYATYPLTELTPGGSFSNKPLEMLVEREGIPGNWHTAVQAGQQFEAIIRQNSLQPPIADPELVIRLFRDCFPLNPLTAESAAQTDQDTLRFLRIMSGKVVNGSVLRLWASIHPNDLQTINGKALQGITPDQFKKILQEFLSYYNRLGFESPTVPASWRNEPLNYQFKIGGKKQQDGSSEISTKFLQAPNYQNGNLDWYHFNASENMPGVDWRPAQKFSGLPTHLRLRGASLRWWEFEDATLDFGHLENVNQPDMAKLLLIGFILFYADDWYTFSLPTEMSSLVRVNSLKVTNVFGEVTTIKSAQVLTDNPLTRWEVFSLSPVAVEPDAQPVPGIASAPGVHGFDRKRYRELQTERLQLQAQLKTRLLSTAQETKLMARHEKVLQSLQQIADTHTPILLVPPAAGFREESAPLEEIRFLRDENANLVWAVERTLLNNQGQPISGFDRHRELDSLARFQQIKTLKRVLARTQKQLQRVGLDQSLQDKLQADLDIAEENLQRLENTPPAGDRLQYRLKSSLPPNWIPFLPIRRSDASVMLQQGTVKEDDNKTARSHLLKYLTAVDESSIPRSGRRLLLTAQRLRWTDGSTYTWIGRKVAAGEGEGSSGLRFDDIASGHE